MCQGGDRPQEMHASQNSPTTIRTPDDGARRAGGIATRRERKLAGNRTRNHRGRTSTTTTSPL